jgi:hypothetical protein
MQPDAGLIGRLALGGMDGLVDVQRGGAMCSQHHSVRPSRVDLDMVFLRLRVNHEERKQKQNKINK